MSKITSAIAALGVVAGLGVAALPLSTYAVDPASEGPVTVKVTVNNDLALASDTSEVDFQELNSGSGVVVKNAAAKLTVSGTVKYKLSVHDTDATTALTLLNADGTPDTTTNAGIPNTATLADNVSGWGLRKNGGAWIELDGTTPVELDKGDLTTTGSKGAPIDTEVDFGISIGSNLTNGTYQDQIMFTALEDTGA